MAFQRGVVQIWGWKADNDQPIVVASPNSPDGALPLNKAAAIRNSQGTRKKVIQVLLVPGTFALHKPTPSASWFSQNGEFARKLRPLILRRYQTCRILTHRWSTDNRTDARADAAENLRSKILKLAAEGDVLIVAHSHGGTVASRAISPIEERSILDNIKIITIGMPRFYIDVNKRRIIQINAFAYAYSALMMGLYIAFLFMSLFKPFDELVAFLISTLFVVIFATRVFRKPLLMLFPPDEILKAAELLAKSSRWRRPNCVQIHIIDEFDIVQRVMSTLRSWTMALSRNFLYVQSLIVPVFLTHLYQIKLGGFGGPICLPSDNVWGLILIPRTKDCISYLEPFIIVTSVLIILSSYFKKTFVKYILGVDSSEYSEVILLRRILSIDRSEKLYKTKFPKNLRKIISFNHSIEEYDLVCDRICQLIDVNDGDPVS